MMVVIGAGDGNQFGTVGQPFEIQAQFVAAQAVADAPKPLEGQ